jgi:hypothetical protein
MRLAGQPERAIFVRRIFPLIFRLITLLNPLSA